MPRLSLDQIVKDTSDFIISLFAQDVWTHNTLLFSSAINAELKVRDVHTQDDLLALFFHRNFETTQSDSQDLLATGLGVFLFFTLSKLYSENMNHHAMMEKLVATLLERISILYLEFLIFLMVMNLEETVGTSKLFQTAFQGMYFDKMCDLVNRCTGNLENFHQVIAATLKYSFIAFPTVPMLAIVNVFLGTVYKTKQDQFRQGISFVQKIFNPKVGFELELNATFRNMSMAYRGNLKYFFADCLKPGLLPSTVQSCFWQLHHIITQEDEEQSFESTVVALRETINSLPNLKNKKQEILPFLWGFREYFESKFAKLSDERVMVTSLSNIVCLRSELTDFVYLLAKPLDDKMIKKSLRIFLQTASDESMITNLCDHLYFWKERGFTKTVILKRLEEYFDKRQGNIDRTLLERLN